MPALLNPLIPTSCSISMIGEERSGSAFAKSVTVCSIGSSNRSLNCFSVNDLLFVSLLSPAPNLPGLHSSMMGAAVDSKSAASANTDTRVPSFKFLMTSETSVSKACCCVKPSLSVLSIKMTVWPGIAEGQKRESNDSFVIARKMSAPVTAIPKINKMTAETICLVCLAF